MQQAGRPAHIHRLVHDPDGLNTATWPVETTDLITPIDQFFTRSHAQVPQIEIGAWRLLVDGLVERALSFTLDELLSTFPQRQITATLVCAGLRRAEFLAKGPLPGELPWGPEPASTARWTGVCLRDVLHAAGVREGARHVEFVGLDQVERHGRQFGFGGSIDLAKADDVILAHELNGKALPAVHGFPLRVIVPGWIGARSVKWLGRITLLDEPSSNYFQARAYRFRREIDPQDPRDVSGGTALTEVPLNSVILHPAPSQVVPAGRVRVFGWAMGAGGRALTAVQLSSNGGTDWTPARIVTASGGRTWSYWEVTLDLVPGRYSLVVRAADTTGIPQPSSIDATWNVKGYNNNAWHRVTAEVI